MLTKLYNGPGYISKVLCRSSKRIHTKHYINTPFHLPQIPNTSTVEKVVPRISLRYAASYYFMGYFCWVIIIARIFGFGWMPILFVAVLFAIISVIAHIDSPPKKFKDS